MLGPAEFADAVREGAATRDATIVRFVQDEIIRLTGDGADRVARPGRESISACAATRSVASSSRCEVAVAVVGVQHEEHPAEAHRDDLLDALRR